MKLKFNPADADKIIQLALTEDIGKGDATSRLLPKKNASARIIVKTPGIICGLPLVSQIYNKIDKKLKIRLRTADGDTIKTMRVVAEISGNARAILTGERTVLNFLSLLSGIATATARYVRAIKGTRADIYDTRKTHPGLRALAKYAVRAGGGKNHRMRLDDMVLIKDNHLEITDFTGLAREARNKYPGMPIELEIDSLKELDRALCAHADIIMLDNMSPAQIRAALARAHRLWPSQIFEASGGITLKNVREFAITGVQRIAIGAITHSAPILDISMEITSLQR
ncbi:MAG: nicotinate-nucleotide diphosphorylase (carboxylating) [Candidatus Raymondbacteria bacterium RifOxyA12_full_50_37]|nr:MAG: nicotinate-nucleotide diphosphorylase (carboxylating) [Candidatus Raymondbacteria bacterium RifOxyA12_full_50_37]OGJ85449.1 MAG: nicotinate-nucleotide diphosphorylase (carboxylating) [Candidatus Raymondbacteria bacterium RIFOXYA2_FULL_49_16]OGJ94957.1 MAG: nicotinate-nucleotide diphosphorylase (carboxylating) [Candidatus Raymondbacteria bacterium RIFOXYC2_FULL_50_21]OGP45589.1 MAG: nicotinate-nucleotide diphosphorylase (carboxylating) [Candidatus Raymondbacteria bacterium RIFOXYB2_FULL_4